jgi:Family of unknown function (DUF6082)
MRWPRISRPTNSISIRIMLPIFAAGLLTLVIISPLALQRLAGISEINWMDLSNVGQTYGAVSALLAALALGGVVISLLYQARDVKTAREQASRAVHHELLKMEMEDPFYMGILAAPWGLGAGLADYDSLRRNNFIHLWVSFWEGLYMLGDMSDSDVQSSVSTELFTSADGRRYWSSTRDAKLSYAKGRRRRFVKIVDQEYQKAVAGGPPVVVPPVISSDKPGTTISGQRSPAVSGVLICIATGGAILVGRFWGRRSSRRPRPQTGGRP